MRRVFTTFSVTASAVLFFAGAAFACFESYRPSLHLRSYVIRGTVASNGRPLGNALVILRTVSSELAGVVPPDGHILNDVTTYNESLFGLSERQTPRHFTLRETWTDKDGSFSLGEYHAGKYSISVSGLGGRGDIEVELVAPEKWQDDSVGIAFYEGCQRAKAVPASVHDSELHSK